MGTRVIVGAAMLVTLLACFLLEYSGTLNFTQDLIQKVTSTRLIKKLQAQSNSTTEKMTYLNQIYPSEQRRRIHRINTVCKEKDIFRNPIYKGKNSTFYYYSPTYNFTYCKVTKSGSTFWMQIFNILENGVENTEELFSEGRTLVHYLANKFTVKIESHVRKKSLSVIVSRDPFSRLFSAFIDRSYLFLDDDVNKNILQLRPTWVNKLCPDDITFKEFLDFIILKVGIGETLNRHWAPIYNLCRPCDVNAYILVKQESFSKDVEQALKAFSVPDEKLGTILSALHELRIETTIPGIVQTVLNKNKITNNGTCVCCQKLIQKIWTAFKIQGYLKETIKFPRKLFNSSGQYDNTSYVSEVILAAIKRNKMTSSEMKRQRYKALVDAYKKIRNETLTQIVDIYKFDFKMFNYSTIAPH